MYFDFRWMILPPHAPKRFLCSSYFRKNSHTNQNIKKQAVKRNPHNHLFYKNNYGAPKGSRTPDLQIRSCLHTPNNRYQETLRVRKISVLQSYLSPSYRLFWLIMVAKWQHKKGWDIPGPFSSVGQKYILWELMFVMVVLSGMSDVLISHLQQQV